MDIVNWGIIGLGNINISHSILMGKKETNYPGMSLSETLLNMKILEEWLND